MTDENLHAAITELDTAMHRLFGPRQDETGIWTASIWAQMVDAVHDRPAGGNRGVFSTGAVANLAALDFVREVENTTRALVNYRDDPQTILESLAQVSAWGPERTPEVEQLAKTINGWARQGEQLIHPQSVMEIPKIACPNCDRLEFYSNNEYGEPCKKAALQVTTGKASCLVCKSEWSPLFLARLIGAELPDEIEQELVE